MKNCSDEQLISDYLNSVRGQRGLMGGQRKRTSNGVKDDKEALGALIKRYLKPIYSFVYRYVGNGETAEDITQEVFVKVWRNLKKFKREYKFKTWIFHIAKNTCLDWFKKKQTVPFSALDNENEDFSFAETIKDPMPLPNELLERQDATAILNKVLEGLLPKYRMVLFLRYNDHFTFREIAKVLEEPLNTIKSRHRRAIIMLKKLLSDIL